MRYWVIKGNPRRNDWHSMLIPRRSEDWVTALPPKDWSRGDRIFCWESSPKKRIVGLAELVDPDKGEDRAGQRVFSVKYRSPMLERSPGIVELRRNRSLRAATFLKAGPAKTVFALTEAQAAALYGVVSRDNPKVKSIWGSKLILDADHFRRQRRQSEGYAQAVFESLFRTEGARRAVAEFLADVIERAATTTTNWSITLDADSVRVNVGLVRLFALCEDQIWFCAVGNMPDKLPSYLEDLSKGRVVYPSVRIASRQYQLKAGDVSRLPTRFQAAALDYVSAAGTGRTGRSVTDRAHSPGVLRFLESFLGRPMPESPADSNPSKSPAAEVHLLSTEGDPSLVFHEGATIRVYVDAYERNPKAREACLRYWGRTCFVCRFDYGKTYGEFADGYIHVHHLKPLAEIKERYRVDPKKDLRPVCPNCHAALHIGGECRDVEAFRRELLARKSKRG